MVISVSILTKLTNLSLKIGRKEKVRKIELRDAVRKSDDPCKYSHNVYETDHEKDESGKGIEEKGPI